MVYSSHMKLLSKVMQGRDDDDDDEVNESEEFNGKHYFVGSFCFTGDSHCGSCVIPSLAIRLRILFLVVFFPLTFPLFRVFRHF